MILNSSDGFFGMAKASAKATALSKATALITLLLISNLSASEISSYSANYSASFNGMEIKASHRLEQLESGQYRETLKARNIFGEINEQALFTLDDEQQIMPQQYSYERSLLGVKRAEKQTFDWPNQQLEYRKKDNIKTMPLTTGSLDIITHKLQLRQDLAAGKEILSYPVISRGKLKQYDYKLIAKPVLETALGPLNTVLVQRVREDNKRQTKIWLAIDWDYLAVQLEQIEDGESHEMRIIDGQVNNQPVLPLQIATEN
jgi:hypothetical protein